MPRKIIAGFTTAAALAAGGAATDNAINPYEVSAEKYELRAASVIEAAGENEIEAHRDRPAVTFQKWNGEAGMTVAYAGVNARGTRQFLTDRVEWRGEKEEVHAYPLDAKEGMEDGGFEIEVVLSERPETNRWEFTIEGADDLDFFYQPALTPEEIADGVERPENVVGSYAVYHKTKANHRIGGTNYATGKAFHIYRPKAIDANGVEEWCELGYEGRTLSVTCSEKWLESAAYPVRIDPTFGYTTCGASNATIRSTTSNALANAYPFVSSGTLDSISACISRNQASSGNITLQLALYEKDGAAKDSHTLATSSAQTTTFPANASKDWHTRSFSGHSLSAGDKLLYATGSGAAGGAFYQVWHDTTSAYSINQGNITYSNPPSDPWDQAGNSGFGYSLYATFTCDPAECSPYVETFNVPGYASWTAPTGVTTADVACWGGGGGGGDGSNAGAGGGGGGAFASSTVSVSPGTQYTLFIGAGGTGAGNSTVAGGNGATTTFATTTVVAAPGWGGRPGSSADSIGGLGGAAASSTGDVIFAGGRGGGGRNTNDTGGGGGGAAGPHGAGGNGANGEATTGQGGGGGGGNGGSNSTSSTGGTSTAGGAGGNGGNVASGASGFGSTLGGGGGGGGDDGATGGAGGTVGAGGGGGEITGGAGRAGQCTITYTISSTALLETLTDNFDDNSLDSGKWLNWGGGNVVETNQRIEVTTNSTSGYFGMGSQDVYDLTGSYAHVELVSAGNQSLASLEIVPMELVLDTDNSVQWLIAGNTIYARKKVAGSATTVASTAYNSSTHRWLKIRESGGTIYYEVSTDGVSWNAFGNTTVAFDYTGLEFGLTAGTWANEGVGSAMHIDNVNIAGAPTTLPGVGTFYWGGE